MEDNIKMCYAEIRWQDADWIRMAQNRDHKPALVNTNATATFDKRRKICSLTGRSWFLKKYSALRS